MKKALIAGLPLAIYLAVVPSAFAQIIECEGAFNSICSLGVGDFGSILGAVITFMFVIAIVIALIYLIYGGIKWITSGGDKQGVENARNHIIAAVIGLVVVFLSYFILLLILRLFGISDTANLTNLLPNIAE